MKDCITRSKFDATCFTGIIEKDQANRTYLSNFSWPIKMSRFDAFEYRDGTLFAKIMKESLRICYKQRRMNGYL